MTIFLIIQTFHPQHSNISNLLFEMRIKREYYRIETKLSISFANIISRHRFYSNLFSTLKILSNRTKIILFSSSFPIYSCPRKNISQTRDIEFAFIPLYLRTKCTFVVSNIDTGEINVNTISYLYGLLRGVPRRALDLSLGLQAHRCTISATRNILKTNETKCTYISICKYFHLTHITSCRQKYSDSRIHFNHLYPNFQ